MTIPTPGELARMLTDAGRCHEVTKAISAILERESGDGISAMEADLWEQFGPEIARRFWERAHDQTIAHLEALP